MYALTALPRTQVVEPFSNQEVYVDDLFTQHANDFPKHQLFLNQWGVLIEKKVTYGSVGSCGQVVKTCYDFVVAKCYKQKMHYDAWREARTLCYLGRENIPHIPKLYGASPYIERPILILNYAGPDLSYCYNHNKLQLKDISRIAKEILGCIQSLEKKGISHNDIKPNNVCYRRDQGITLIDWEGASSTGAPEPTYSFTLSYQPPEACLKLKCATDSERSKADVWAAAATVFSILAFDGSLVNPMERSISGVLNAVEQRLSPLPQEMINASPIKDLLFLNNRLRFIGVCGYIPATLALKKGKQIARRFFNPFSEKKYQKIRNLVLALLKINPKERPSAEEALKKHFPSAAASAPKTSQLKKG